MAISLQREILHFIALLASFFVARTTAVDHRFEASASPAPSPFYRDPQDNAFFTQTTLLQPILSHLGYHDLSTAVPSLSIDSTISWTGPSTLFAPSDVSVRSCISCSISNLLREHIVPGLFTIDFLRKLHYGTKIETLSSGRCITVTSEIETKNNFSDLLPKIFIGGVEITRPDLFNNDLFVVHGIQGYVSPLSPFSCDVERMSSMTFPFTPDRGQQAASSSLQPALMRLMLRDAMMRLRSNGFNILSLAMRVKFAELVGFQNMTMFALDDISIFSGMNTYIRNVRFHIVPNYYLTINDLESLPAGTVLPSLERGQSLVVTTAGAGSSVAPLRINYVRIKVPEVMRNLNIVVHSVFLPFPHIHPLAPSYDDISGEGEPDSMDHGTPGEECVVVSENGECAASMSPESTPTVEIEDHHGL